MDFIPGRVRLILVSLLLLWFGAGCATTGPRFSPEIQQSYRHEDMRKMETERLAVYYPEQRHREARQIASRLQGCLDDLEDQVPRPTDWGPIPIYLPEVEFNNAYVMFGLGQEPHVVVPTFFTANFFGQFGYTPSASAVACHEIVHYVHLIQIHGFYRAVNEFFGPSINPQIGLDLWFFEGLATYYESRLVDGVGRYGSPIWENAFASGIAGDRFDGGRLSHLDREIPFGAHYLVGSYFVAYLADEYGEETLWELVDRQGSSILFPLNVSLRFFLVYEKSLGDLLDEFERHVRDTYRVRKRPGGQTKDRWLGRSAAFEVDDSGRQAVFYSDVDEVATIEVFGADGERQVRRRLPDLFPGRDIVASRGVESLRFSPEENGLYFLVNHRGRDHQRTSLMRLDTDRNRVDTVRDDIRGIGGDFTPEGHWVLATADGDRIRFRRLDLDDADGDEELFALPPGAYVGWVRISPDGTRLAATLMEDEKWSVAVFDLDGGELLGEWTTGQSHRPVFDPYWIDDQTLLFAASDGERIEVVEGDLEDETATRLTNVPYMAFNPRLDDNGTLRFLNRDGWGWALDRLETDATDAEPTEAVSYRTTVDDEPVAATGYDAPERPAQVFTDEPYSMLDGLFIPRFRAPGLLIGAGGRQIEASLGLSGYDELGFHNWMIEARWDFAQEQLSGTFAYVNNQLAPWVWSLQVTNQWLTTQIPTEADPAQLVAQDQRDRFVRMTAQRPVYDIPVGIELTAADYLREEEGVEDETRTLVGGEAQASYRAHRSTSYGGAQWMLGLSGRAGGYPAQLGSDFSMAHLRSQLEVHTPLPLSKRHRLRLSGRVRALPGVPEGENLMRVGGFDAFPLFLSRRAEQQPITDDLLPSGFLFVEPLRGYEDLGLVTNRVAIADANYRYPFIVDRGASSMLMFLPSVFLRQFDLQGFASAATLMDGELRTAVGTSFDMAFDIWRLPLRLRLQLAQRLVVDEQTVFSISLGAGGGL